MSIVNPIMREKSGDLRKLNELGVVAIVAVTVAVSILATLEAVFGKVVEDDSG